MSLPVRDHDPFCGIRGQYQVPCVICDRIEKVRADEREKAVIRVLATMPPCASYNTVNAVYAAAAAVRGES